LPEYGFGNQINYAASESTKQKVFWWVLWVRVYFQMSKKNALYAAMFLDSGYGSIIEPTKRVL
jgi:hypothetical protein